MNASSNSTKTDKKHCLFVFPPFTSESFWNYRKTCDLLNAKYPAAPLGLITVAAMLPENWEVRLVDCNVEELSDDDLRWADLIFSGGMIAQQVSHLQLLKRTKEFDAIHIVGGPDATSCPHLYEDADHLVLGEAEITLPRFLNDLATGSPEKIYEPAFTGKGYTKKELADVSTSPIPRFDLLDFSQYLHVGVQFARGCPFRCEFCDIIELFGRVPRIKGTEQILTELQTLYDLGYRGHIDFVDDNFIGNKKLVKAFLPQLKTWLEDHKWPFEFTTEASLNLSDDDELMELMQEVGFSAIFVGIETPDEVALLKMQKTQNMKRSIPDSIRRIYAHGMFVNAGYIVGLDGEKGSVVEPLLRNIEETAIPVNMIGLLFVLRGTQLERRLQKENRVGKDFEVAPGDVGDQCLAGLNFVTSRPRSEILSDYKTVVAKSYAPKSYFGRVREVVRQLDCSKKRMKVPIKYLGMELRGLMRLVYAMGIKASYRKEFWNLILYCGIKNIRAMRYAMALTGLYLHFGPFSQYIDKQLVKDIARAREIEAMATPQGQPQPAEQPAAAQA